MSNRMGEGWYCRGCESYLPHEKFSGRGHRIHLCQSCAARQRAERRASPDALREALADRLAQACGKPLLDVGLFHARKEREDHPRGWYAEVWGPWGGRFLVYLGPSKVAARERVDELTPTDLQAVLRQIYPPLPETICPNCQGAGIDPATGGPCQPCQQSGLRLDHPAISARWRQHWLAGRR